MYMSQGYRDLSDPNIIGLKEQNCILMLLLSANKFRIYCGIFPRLFFFFCVRRNRASQHQFVVDFYLGFKQDRMLPYSLLVATVHSCCE
jgi:hypothetical protein